MRRSLVRVVFGCSSSWLVLACTGPEVGPASNPTPILHETVPSLLLRGPATTDVEVYGLGFVEGAEVLWGGDARPTTFVSSTLLSVQLTAADLLLASSDLSVANPPPGGGTSSALVLAVGNPVPTVSSLSPTSAPAVVTQELTLQVFGSDFMTGSPGAQVFWDGSVTYLLGSIKNELDRLCWAIVFVATMGGFMAALGGELVDWVPVTMIFVAGMLNFVEPDRQ
jgi:hypothetical protein